MGPGYVKDMLDKKQTIDIEAEKEKKQGKPSHWDKAQSLNWYPLVICISI